MASDLDDFAAALAAYRGKQKISQAELGLRLDASQGTVWKWENSGSGVLSNHHARKIKEVIGIDAPRARRPNSDPRLPERVAVLEATVELLAGRLAKLEKRRPPKKSPSASNASSSKDEQVTEGLSAGQREREERLRRR